MKSILFFAVGASLSGTLFLVAILELLLTVRRRKVAEELEAHIKALKADYNTSLNRVVLEDEAKMEEIEKQAPEGEASSGPETEALAAEYEAKLAEVTAKSDKAVEAARAKAKKLEQEAKEQASAYLAERQKEVEEELMDLVLNVTKKVLPAGITYQAQADLVLQALRDARLEKEQK
jgi:hypothetical protein